MSILNELVSSSVRRVAEARTRISEQDLQAQIDRAEPPRGFRRSLESRDVALIAEIKRATPFKGMLNGDLDAGTTAATFAAGGAAAISVLTEPSRFAGSLDDLAAARAAGLPLLRKDFVVDDYQVMESRAAGSDAVLLIVRILGDELADLIKAIEALDMDALVEVHDESELQRAVDAGARTIGINHRDLETGEVDPNRTAALAPLVPDEVLLIGLSGVSTRSDVEALIAAGARAVLVGEALVTARNPESKLRELLGV
ncbi:MAG TPA: indole-3-glycerol phosphate synthase TrpC [Actinomycetota bacterium]|nr:indole-3-glycerol phosphate synthase TrpC [Actinomycetota bacterium]